jgi:hypothetical protein
MNKRSPAAPGSLSRKVCVPQGQSITYDGIRFHQGAEIEVPADYVFDFERAAEAPAAPDPEPTSQEA